MSIKSLQKAHEEYKAERERVKAQQRIELEARLVPNKKALGKEISELANSGVNMVEITEFLGMKNRNYTYDMLREFTGEEKRSFKRKTKEDAPKDKPYTWVRKTDFTYFVSTTDGNYSLQIIGGDVIPPDDWANGTLEQRKVYKQIIAEVTDDLKSGH